MHPDLVLSEVYMSEMDLNQSKFARMCEYSPRKIIRGISTSFALLLEEVLGTTTEMWLRMQAEYDLFETRREAA